MFKIILCTKDNPEIVGLYLGEECFDISSVNKNVIIEDLDLKEYQIDGIFLSDFDISKVSKLRLRIYMKNFSEMPKIKDVKFEADGKKVSLKNFRAIKTEGVSFREFIQTIFQ